MVEDRRRPSVRSRRRRLRSRRRIRSCDSSFDLAVKASISQEEASISQVEVLISQEASISRWRLRSRMRRLRETRSRCVRRRRLRTVTAVKVIPLQDQLQQFETLVTQNNISKNSLEQSLVLFESGSNDLYNFFLGPPGLNPDAYIKAMLAEVRTLVDRLYNIGVRRIALFSLGPVGCVPAQISLPNATAGTCYEKVNAMVRIYNKGLNDLVMGIPVKYAGAKGVYGNVYAMFDEYRSAPNKYGMANVVSACCGAGNLNGQVQCGRKGFTLCSNANQFLFWDYFHPSEHTYHLISKSLWSGKRNRVRPINLQTLANLALRR